MPNATWVRTRPTSLFRTWTCAASPFSRMPSTANGTTAWTRMRPTPNRQVKFAQDPKALEEDSYRAQWQSVLEQHGLRVFTLSNHLVGQAVCDVPLDKRHQ